MGPDYAHAEARKSPALDGKVERDSEGKEVRYPVMLSAMEKLVARKVCLAFKVLKGISFMKSGLLWFTCSFIVDGLLIPFHFNIFVCCSKLCVALIFSEPTDTLMSVTSTASAL